VDARDIAYAVGPALLGAMSFAGAAVLQQEATQSVPEEDSLRLRLLFALLRRRKWVAGVLLMIAGYGLQGLALAFGPVALVQPLIVTELAFAIPLAIWRRRMRPRRREWLGIFLVLAGVATFLVVADPAAGIASPPLRVWLLSLLPVAAPLAAAIVVATRLHGRSRAALLGAAAGLAFGLLAVLTKALAYLIRQDPARAPASWQLYVVIALGIFALVLSQSAYQAGPLAFSMPFVGVLEPVVAVVIGDTALNEQVQLSLGLLAIEASAAAAAAAGVLLLSTSPVVLSIYEDSRRERAIGRAFAEPAAGGRRTGQAGGRSLR
jgi:drug/metabolite transporter (DMT)-like permease